MRKRPMAGNGGMHSQGGKKPMRRFSSNKSPYNGGGGDGGGNYGHHGHQRPRKNYGAAREKYLMQARDALACGDRVLAENWYQHAEHCFRVMQEEGARFRQQNPTQPQQENPAAEGHAQHEMQEQQPSAAEAFQEEAQPRHNSSLPAFLTQGLPAQPREQAGVPVTQDWEERDQS